MSSTDTILFKFTNGDIEALNTLIDTYQTGLYSLCYRLTANQYDADDLFQQTWIKVIKNQSKYKNIGFKSWLYRICINQYKDNYRKQRVKDKHIVNLFADSKEKSYIIESSQAHPSAERVYEMKNSKERLIEMVNLLPEKQRIPLMLHYFQAAKYSEISKIMGVSEGTIKSRINTAKKKLKRLLESEI